MARVSFLAPVALLAVLLSGAFAQAQEPGRTPSGNRIRDYFLEETQNPDGSRTLKLYTQPIRYRDADGLLHPVDLEPRVTTDGGLEAYRVDRTPVRSTVRRDGRMIVEHEGHRLELWPDRAVFDDGTSPGRTRDLQTSTLGRQGRTVSVRSAFAGIDVDYQALATGIKETVVLPGGFRAKIPDTVNALRLVWRWRGLGLTPLLDKAAEGSADPGTVTFRDGDEGVFRLEPVVVVDAGGAFTQGRYVLETGAVAVEVDAAWLRDPQRVYPVSIDPTVVVETTKLLALLFNPAFGGTYKKVLIEFSLPGDLAPVTTATFHAQAISAMAAPHVTYPVNSHVVTMTWLADPGYAGYLDALPLGDVLDTQDVSLTGAYAWDVTAGIQAAQAEGKTNVTVVLHAPQYTTPATGGSTGMWGFGATGAYVTFAMPDSETPPHLEILTDGPSTPDPPGPATNPRVGGSASNPVYTTDTTPTLSWTAPTSGGDPTGYKVYVDGVLKTTVAHPTTSYTVSPALTANGNLHSWSVVATNDGGDGPSMTGNGFRVGTAPSTVSLLTPAAGAYTTDRTPDFDWSDATGTAPITYDFHFNGSAVTGSTNLSTSAFTPTTDLAYGAGTWRVIAKNAYGQSQTGNRTVNIGTIPSTFSLTAPATGTKIAVANQSSVNLDWGDSTASGGATATVKYDLQINRGSGFVTEKEGLSASATTLSGLANGALPAGSKYTWRVRAFNNYGQRYSTEQNWTLDVGAPPGGAPSAFQITGGYPSTTANPNYLTSNTFQVTWTPPTPGTGTTRYKVRVDGGAETDSASGGTAASYTAGPFSGNASHVVEVRAYNDYGTLGYVVGPTVWVNGVVPSAPSITAPTSNAKWTDTTPTYTWTAPGTGTAPFTYHVRLDGEGSDRYAGGDLTYTEPTPLSLGAHTVSVAASNLYGKGPAASVNFSLGVAPSAASLVAPATGVKVDRTTQNLSFSWTAPSTGTSPFQYRVLVDRGEGYVAESEYLSTPSWSLSESIVNPVFDANGTYTWRVEASNGYGTPSLSAERTVLIGDKPSAVAITGPGDGAYVTENAPTFTWTADPGSEAPTYAVWVDGTQQVSGLAVTSWKRGSAYSWNTHTGYVVATNGYGSSQSAVVTFHLGTIPGTFSLVTPADGIKRERTDDVPGTDLTWGESTASGPDSAPKYEVQIDRGDGFEAEATDLEVRSFVLGDLETPLPVGVHAWRVRAYNAYGERFSGTARTLDVGDKPGPIVLVAPPDGTVTANPRPTFVWEGSDGTGATTYRLRLDESSADTYAGPLKTFTPETPFATGIHSWRVVGENEYGSRTSEPFGFTIVVPGASPAVGYWLL